MLTIHIATVPAGQQREIYEWALGRTVFTALHVSKALNICHQSAIRACDKLVSLNLLTIKGRLLGTQVHAPKLFQAVIPERRAVVDCQSPLDWPVDGSVPILDPRHTNATPTRIEP